MLVVCRLRFLSCDECFSNRTLLKGVRCPRNRGMCSIGAAARDVLPMQSPAMLICIPLCCTGLNGCSELQQLHISHCGLAHLSRCRVLQQLTESRLHGNEIGWPVLDVVAVAMPRLVILDISNTCDGESRQAFAAFLVRPPAIAPQPNLLQPYVCFHTQSFATIRYMHIMSACIPQD
jgi:hypothetical protein